jgi:hypothetical protein
MRVSPRVGSKKNVEKRNEPEESVPLVVVLPNSNPTVVSQLSPEFENKAQNELGNRQ